MTYEPSAPEKALLEKLLGIKNELKQLVASNDELVRAVEKVAKELYMRREAGRHEG